MFKKQGKGAPRTTAQGSREFIVLRVQCGKCGEEIEVRARRSTDLMPDYDQDLPNRYILRKEILGTRCNNLIYADLVLDENMRIVSADVTGGSIIEPKV